MSRVSPKIYSLPFATSSFKKKIIKRIVASVQYYISIGDLYKAEAGLITVLNAVGFVSSETIGV